MRVGILTYHRSINYGAVMQAYALSTRLGEIENLEVEIIDYMSRKMDIYYKLFTLYRGKNGMHRIIDRFSMYQAFCRGILQLPLSEKKLISDNEKKFYEYIADKYDVIIVGSDAVWNYEKRGLPNPYFLMKEMTATKKISYAASCNGIKYNNITNEKLKVLKEAFSGFEYIGVRDMLTEDIVEQALGKKVAVHNCDPTFLLDFEKDGLGSEYLKALEEKLIRKYKWEPAKKHIGLMLSNLNGEIAEKLVASLKKQYGDTYQIVSIYSFCQYADIPYIADLTPFEWSRIFALFDITFSKYFHGTLLSIKNSTPVIAMSAEEDIDGIPAKVEDVLRRLDLMEFYYPVKKESDIDWTMFIQRVDTLIKNPPIEKMSAGVEREKKTSEAFFEYIRNL